MKFIDTAVIKLFAGKGGDGAVAFRRELYVPKGGPAGGDGGDGGDIIFVGNEGLNTLLDLKYQKEIKADNGEKGGIKNMHGANAAYKEILVPLGTLIYDNNTNELIADITTNNQKAIICLGGKGGKGNAHFANSRNKTPMLFEAGTLGERKEIRCELKVLADVGLVGLPNAGKSTLLSKISKAKPQIADYPFTTLTPQLGVCHNDNNFSFVVADLPGLIAGASQGKGLGHDFLRHIERCKVIAHVLDMSGNYGAEDVIQNYWKIKKELQQYNTNLELRKEIIVANKMDIDGASENLIKFKKTLPYFEIIEISGLYNQNLSLLLNKLAELVQATKNNNLLWSLSDEQTENESYRLYKYVAKENDVKVVNNGNKVWTISGEDVAKVYQKYPIRTYDNLLMFNKKLQQLNVFQLLREKGAQPGDIINIFDYQLEWGG